jgi:hypothetical protein
MRNITVSTQRPTWTSEQQHALVVAQAIAAAKALADDYLTVRPHPTTH